MTDPLTTMREAGFTVLGQEGTAEEVRAVWRRLNASPADPTFRIPDDDPEPDAVEVAWARVAAVTGLCDAAGDFLVSVSGPGNSKLPWTRVRATPGAQVLALGPTPGVPDFVATSIDRGVEVGVTSEEDETWIFVAGDRSDRAEQPTCTDSMPLPVPMTDPLTTVREAGFTVLGQEGTVEEVRAVWRQFIAGDAVPTLRIPDDDPDPDVVEVAWARVAAATGLCDASGEFLLSVGGVGESPLPWMRVRTAPDARVVVLGPIRGEPEFVATSIDRCVEIGVTTEEDETWILVAGDRSGRAR